MVKTYCDICGKERKTKRMKIVTGRKGSGWTGKVIDICEGCYHNLMDLHGEVEMEYYRQKGGSAGNIMSPEWIRIAKSMMEYHTEVEITFLDEWGRPKKERFNDVVLGMTVTFRDSYSGKEESCEIPWMKAGKVADLKWDSHGNRTDLPDELLIPPGLTDDKEISEYLTETIGCRNKGYRFVDET